MRFVRVVLSLIAALIVAQTSYGAAQLKAGAKTSAQPTATNPQQRQIQITFDPEITPDAVAIDTGPTYSLTSFQLSVKYDSRFVTLDDLFYVDPFTETPTQTSAIGAKPAVTFAENYTNNPATGTVSFIAGFASAKAVPAGQDVNIFAIDFLLNQGVSMGTPLSFTIFANPDNGDFVMGTDPTTGQTITTAAAGVIPTTIVLSFNEATAQVNPTPLPAGAWAGFATLGILAGGHALRRRILAA